MCQGCVDKGYLSQSTYDAIEAFNEKWPQAEFGPAHIVLSDCNIENDHLASCMKDLDNMMRFGKRTRNGICYRYWEAPWEEIVATGLFILQLRMVPEEER